jgi:hypothetical protein
MASIFGVFKVVPRATQIVKAKLIAHDPKDVPGSGHVLLAISGV